MKIIHFSDLHVWRATGMDGDWAVKRVLGRINLWLRRARRYPPEWGRAVIEAIAAREADLVVFTGDATSAALKAEFETAQEWFEPLRRKWGDRFVLVPGNHDRYTRRATAQRLFEQYLSPPATARPAPQPTPRATSDAASAATPELARQAAPDAASDGASISSIASIGALQTPLHTPFPFSRSLNAQIGLVAIDVSIHRPFSSRGFLTREQITRIRALVEAQRVITPCVIVVGHYPIAYPHGAGAPWHHRLPLAADLLAALNQAGAALYLHGHKHQRWTLRPLGPTRLLCVNSGSAGLRSTDPWRAAGFVEIMIEPTAEIAAEAFFLRPHSGQLETQSFPLP